MKNKIIKLVFILHITILGVICLDNSAFGQNNKESDQINMFFKKVKQNEWHLLGPYFENNIIYNSFLQTFSYTIGQDYPIKTYRINNPSSLAKIKPIIALSFDENSINFKDIVSKKITKVIFSFNSFKLIESFDIIDTSLSKSFSLQQISSSNGNAIIDDENYVLLPWSTDVNPDYYISPLDYYTKQYLSNADDVKSIPFKQINFDDLNLKFQWCKKILGITVCGEETKDITFGPVISQIDIDNNFTDQPSNYFGNISDLTAFSNFFSDPKPDYLRSSYVLTSVILDSELKKITFLREGQLPTSFGMNSLYGMYSTTYSPIAVHYCNGYVYILNSNLDIKNIHVLKIDYNQAGDFNVLYKGVIDLSFTINPKDIGGFQNETTSENSILYIADKKGLFALGIDPSTGFPPLGYSPKLFTTIVDPINLDLNYSLLNLKRIDASKSGGYTAGITSKNEFICFSNNEVKGVVKEIPLANYKRFDPLLQPNNLAYMINEETWYVTDRTSKIHRFTKSGRYLSGGGVHGQSETNEELYFPTAITPNPVESLNDDYRYRFIVANSWSANTGFKLFAPVMTISGLKVFENLSDQNIFFTFLTTGKWQAIEKSHGITMEKVQLNDSDIPENTWTDELPKGSYSGGVFNAGNELQDFPNMFSASPSQLGTKLQNGWNKIKIVVRIFKEGADDELIEYVSNFYWVPSAAGTGTDGFPGNTLSDNRSLNGVKIDYIYKSINLSNKAVIYIDGGKMIVTPKGNLSCGIGSTTYIENDTKNPLSNISFLSDDSGEKTGKITIKTGAYICVNKKASNDPPTSDLLNTNDNFILEQDYKIGINNTAITNSDGCMSACLFLAKDQTPAVNFNSNVVLNKTTLKYDVTVTPSDFYYNSLRWEIVKMDYTTNPSGIEVAGTKRTKDYINATKDFVYNLRTELTDGIGEYPFEPCTYYKVTLTIGCNSSGGSSTTNWFDDFKVSHIIRTHPEVNAGASQAICDNITTIDFTGFSPLPEGGIFNSTGGPGTGYWTSSNFEPITLEGEITTGPLTRDIPHTYTYHYTDLKGCSNDASKTVTVHAIPAQPIITTNAPICTGNSLNFSCSDTQTGTTYNWSNPSRKTIPNTGASINFSNVDPSYNGNYSVSVTRNACTSPIATINAIINPLPTVEAGTNAFLCTNSSLYNLNTGATPNNDGTWVGTGVSDNYFNPSVGYGQYTITYNYTDINSCSNTDTKVITVGPLLTATNENTCKESSPFTPTVNALPLGGSGFWSEASINLPGNFFTPSSASLGSHTINYSYTDLNGCSNTISKQIIVNQNPIIPTASNSGPVCLGGTVTLQSSLISGAVYQWTGPNGFNSSLQNPVVSNIDDIQAGEYTLQVIVNGCLSSIGAISKTIVVVNQLPIVTASISASDPICYNTPTFSLIGTPSGGSWYEGTSEHTGSSYIPSTTNIGSHTLKYTYTNSNGCTSSEFTSFSIFPAPVVSISSLSSNKICQEIFTSVALIADPTGNNSPVPTAYKWYKNSSLLPTETGQTYSAISSGIYKVETTNQCGNATSDDWTLEVVPNPVITASAPTAMCVTGSTNKMLVSINNYNSSHNYSITWGNGSNSSNTILNSGSPTQPIIDNFNYRDANWVDFDADNWAGSNINFSSGALAITARGVDVWGVNNQFVAVKRNDIVNDFDVSVLIGSQTASDPYAKAGIMVANSISATSRAGYCFVGVTPGNGVAFQWDANGDGALDNTVYKVHGIAPVTVRMKRVGNVFSAYYLSSPNNWIQIGSNVTLSSASSNQEIALFSTSHSSGNTNITTFDDFTYQSAIRTIQLPVNQPGVYTIDVNDTYPGSCTADINKTINALPLPILDLSGNTLTSVCQEHAPFKLTANPLGGSWIGNGITSQADYYLNDDFSASTLNSSWSTIDFDNYTDGSNSVASIVNQKLLIRASGSDVSGSTSQFTAVKRSDITGDFDVSVKIESQTNTSSYAKAGIIIANDLSIATRSGYAYLAITPANGVLFQWDSDNNGSLDQTASVTNKTAPIYLKLSKINGNTLKAYYGVDGTTWTQIGNEVIPPGITANSQIGLFATSHQTGLITQAVFDNFVTNKNITDYTFAPLSASIGSNALTYAYTDQNRCSNTAPLNINVIHPPQPVISGNANICNNGTSNIYTVSNALPGETFTWAITGKGVIVSTNGNQATVVSSGGGTFTLSAVPSSAEGCIGSAGTYTVNVTAIPSTPSISWTGIPCVGSTIQLLASSIPSATYNWTGPNGFTSTQQNPILTNVTSISTGDYKVKATVNGCTSSDIIPSGNLLAYEGFDYAPGSVLHTLKGGIGWNFNTNPSDLNVGWYNQNNDVNVPGYNVSGRLSPMSYENLTTTGLRCTGGIAYQTTGREFDIQPTGVFASYLDANGKIGKPGTTLWASVLLRKENDNTEDVSVTMSNYDNVAWNYQYPSVAVGYFGSNSENNHSKFWTLQVGGNYYQTSVPVVIGETSLLVVRIDFNATNTINLYVNPIPLGGLPPAVSDVSATTINSLAFNNLVYYGGINTNQSSMDEIRVGTSYASVTPPTTISLDIHPLPVIAIVPVSPLCYTASPVTLSATPAGGSWSGNGVTLGGIFTTAANLMGVNTLTYSYTDVNGCTNSSTLPVTVIEPLLPVITGNNNICNDGNANTYSVTARSGESYTWSINGNGVITSTNNNSVTAKSTNFGTFTLSAQASINSCAGDVANYTVNVKAVPAAPVASKTGNECLGSTIQLYASTIANVSYNWTGPNGFTSTQQNPTFTNITSNTSGSYSVTATLNGCTSAIIASSTVAITVHGIPSITLASSSSTCATTSPYAIPVSPLGGIWSGNGVSPAGLFTPASNLVGSNILTYAYTDVNGCATSAQTIIQVDIPYTSITTEPNKAVCSYEAPFQISASPSGGIWSGTSVSTNGTFTPSTAPLGINTLTYSLSNACGTNTASVDFEINSAPTVNREWVTKFNVYFYTYNYSIDFDIDNNLYILSSGGGSRYFGCSLNTYALTKIGTGGAQKWQYIYNPDNSTLNCGTMYPPIQPSNPNYTGDKVITDHNTGVYVLGTKNENNYSTVTNILTKYSPDYGIDWSVNLSTGACGGSDVITDPNGDLYVTCKNGGSVTKVSKSGAILWTNSSISNPSIKVDNLGNLYVAGINGIPNNILNKYSTSGTLISSTNFSQVPLIETDVNGNVFTVVNQTGTALITKTNTNNTVVWSNTFNSSAISEVKADKQGNLFIKAGNTLSKINSNGNLAWSNTLSMTTWTLDNYGNVYITDGTNLKRVDATTGTVRWTQSYTYQASLPYYPYVQNFPFGMATLKADNFSNVYVVGHYGDAAFYGTDGDLAVKYSQCGSSPYNNARIGQSALDTLIKEQTIEVYPNPFTGQTNIEVVVNNDSASVKLEVFDILGRKMGYIYEGNLNKGSTVIVLDAEKMTLPTGSYVLLGHINGQTIRKKLVRD